MPSLVRRMTNPRLLGVAAMLGVQCVAGGAEIHFRSNILKETRRLLIATPAGYERTTERYPVLYLLDAETHFRYVSGMVEFLAGADRIPEMIVVGVESGSKARRTRDLTPASSSEVDGRFTPGHGGAASFLSFLTKELIPFAAKKYRTRPYRILVGHSHGGLFAAYVFSTSPAVFNAYLAIDPSLSWDNGAVVEQIDSVLSSTNELRADFYFTASHSGDEPPKQVRKLASLIEKKRPAGFRSRFEWMRQETHASIPLRSIHQGLETIFDGWHLTDPLELFEKGGIQAIHRHFREGGERYGYTRTTSPFTVSMIVHGLIGKARLEQASEVLFHDRKSYPPPWNQLDALARAYSDRGNNERARFFYLESLKANPRNEWARKKLQQMGVHQK